RHRLMPRARWNRYPSLLHFGGRVTGKEVRPPAFAVVGLTRASEVDLHVTRASVGSHALMTVRMALSPGNRARSQDEDPARADHLGDSIAIYTKRYWLPGKYCVFVCRQLPADGYDCMFYAFRGFNAFNETIQYLEYLALVEPDNRIHLLLRPV